MGLNAAATSGFAQDRQVALLVAIMAAVAGMPCVLSPASAAARLQRPSA
jgi:hypothetical protein